jgi:hypothetical protein
MQSQKTEDDSATDSLYPWSAERKHYWHSHNLPYCLGQQGLASVSDGLMGARESCA